jgi:hypothetical protein
VGSEGMGVQGEADDLMMASFPNILQYMAEMEMPKKNVEMKYLDLMNYLVEELEAFEANLLVELSLVKVFQLNLVEALGVDGDNLDLKNYPKMMGDMVGEALLRNALNELNSVEVFQNLMVHHLEFQDDDNLLEMKIENFQHL